MGLDDESGRFRVRTVCLEKCGPYPLQLLPGRAFRGLRSRPAETGYARTIKAFPLFGIVAVSKLLVFPLPIGLVSAAPLLSFVLWVVSLACILPLLLPISPACNTSRFALFSSDFLFRYPGTPRIAVIRLGRGFRGMVLSARRSMKRIKGASQEAPGPSLVLVDPLAGLQRAKIRDVGLRLMGYACTWPNDVDALMNLEPPQSPATPTT